MSDNTQAISFGLLEPGMEAMLSIVMRSAMQRSYTATGTRCNQNVIDYTSTTFKITPLGYSFGLAWSILQLIINTLGACMFIPWFTSHDPIQPAIEIANDHVLFTLF